jgi:uncharacterized protein YlxW (UPF0749 family)
MTPALLVSVALAAVSSIGSLMLGAIVFLLKMAIAALELRIARVEAAAEAASEKREHEAREAGAQTEQIASLQASIAALAKRFDDLNAIVLQAIRKPSPLPGEYHHRKE